MKKLKDTINKFRSSIFVEYLPMFFIVVVLFVVVLITIKSDSNGKEITSDLPSCSTFPIPSIGITEEYEDYSKNFGTYTAENFGFSFKYPPHLETFSIVTHIILSYRDDEQDAYGKIIVSVGLNDENMTPEEWLLSPNSGYLQSKDRYGDCYRTTIDGQKAVYTDGGMWAVVNTLDNKYSLSIADLTTGKAQRPFTEMGIVIESLRFLSSDDFLPIAERENVEWEGQVYSAMTYGRRVFKNLDEGSKYKYFIVEPHDYTENGGDKYSPTTRSLIGNERVKITGTIADFCWWDWGIDNTDYKGCVPWIDAGDIEIVGYLAEPDM
jgi:hypothetical protein